MVYMKDKEMRLEGEEFGYFIFAFLPKKCRNNKWRWLCWLERHGEKGRYTYTLGTRGK